MARTKRKTYREIIDETVAYYRDHKRAQKPDGSCMYSNRTGTQLCAVGRCLQDPLKVAEDGRDAPGVIEHYGDRIFRPEYRGKNPDFWEQLQGLHDDNRNWKFKRGGPLSEAGEMAVAELHNIWG